MTPQGTSKLETRWRIINTWNGGTGGLVVEYTSKERGSAGHNECFEWIIKNKPFSFHEALTNQGYKVEPLREE
jgi:hypothetical protein